MIIFFLDSTQSIQIYKSPQNDVICPTLRTSKQINAMSSLWEVRTLREKDSLFNTTRK